MHLPLLVLFFSLLIPVTIADLSSRKIPNIYLAFSTYGLAAYYILTGLASPAIILTIIPLSLLFVFGCGMGDLKLLALGFLSFKVVSFSSLLSVFQWLFLIAGAQICLIFLVKRTMPRSIALAPAIFIAFAAIFGNE